MRINTKCSTAIHILLMIYVVAPHRKVTSDYLAASVGRNPVEIRKIFGGLKEAGLIDVLRGNGGVALKRELKDITLLDIYAAVDNSALNELLGVHTNVSQKCPVGRNIHTLLMEPREKIGDAVKQTMSTITLEDLLNRLYEIDPAAWEFTPSGAGVSLGRKA
ncbi:RRF2 family protein [Treponema primitia ZAS-2]|uniref:RRF2 family protein n=1 Tax=Treponema primitia (strain ATCC BAA-887 / DSM 12427 / ZAS-2) TaxID=545694 RepID=F5YJE5_TREPZ|nr:Rrf2 family transcriptional regulator [Treponema primitia]AEF86044.1 RRF2 family protein [Treponema primitia ZAS-2]